MAVLGVARLGAARLGVARLGTARLGVAVLGAAVLGLALLDVGVAAAAVTAPVGSIAPPPGAGQPVAGAEYAWPLLPPPAVLTPFAAPDDPFGPGHRGVDLAGAVGQPVLAARGGTVVFAGPVAGLGVVSVQHDDGLRTTYEPVAPVVRVGATVAAGDVLGTLTAGHRGCRTTCLHWGVRRDRLDYVDPLVLLLPPHVRLLPVPQPWPSPLRALSRRLRTPSGVCWTWRTEKHRSVVPTTEA
jgi:murein DD-endopeptidase MepM/ murein hydrolase activator NlpD